MNKEEELKIFQNVVGSKKKYKIEYVNYMQPNTLRDIIKNQGISRAKLRRFISENNIESSYWER